MTRLLALFRCRRDDHIHALNLAMFQRLQARRAARIVANERARRGAATRIHRQYQRDPLIKARAI